jgi:hypothetical protein
MTDEVTEAQGAEDIAPEAEPTADTTPEVATEQTVGEMAGDTQPTPRVVDEHVFVAEKKARKAAERRIKELEQSIANGATNAEISDDIAEISEEFDVDPHFLQKLAKVAKTQAEKELDAKYSEKFSAKEKAEKFDDTFTKAYTEALNRGPEFSGIANADVIKQLAQLPQNSRKTVTQLIEETYGNALTGKRTIETTQPGGGKDPEPLDLKRAETDIEYFKEVMADPKKKAQYNKHMIESGL